jgi:hypothetical protein
LVFSRRWLWRMPCGSCRPFGETYHLHHKVNQHFFPACFDCYLLLTFLAWRFFSPWWWRRYVSVVHVTSMSRRHATWRRLDSDLYCRSLVSWNAPSQRRVLLSDSIGTRPEECLSTQHNCGADRLCGWILPVSAHFMSSGIGRGFPFMFHRVWTTLFKCATPRTIDGRTRRVPRRVSTLYRYKLFVRIWTALFC